MIISDLEMCYSADRKTLKALITWENNTKPSQALTFCFLADQDTIDPNTCADPFLTACAPIAYRHGERRLLIEGNVCPLLVENIYTALEYLRNWYWYEYNLKKSAPLDFKIEANSFKPRSAGKPPASACFFSGGADSFDLVLNNAKIFKTDHELKIKKAIYIHGLDFGIRPLLGDEEDFFSGTREKFETPLRELDIELIPAWTNIRLLDRDTHGWQYETHGAAMSAVGQCLSNNISNIWLASSDSIPALAPWGSHPILDRCFRSSCVGIHHYRERATRLDKIRHISTNPSALKALRVCFFGKNEAINCGECTKCIRTKLELLVCGKLDCAETMPTKDVTYKEVLQKYSLSKSTAEFARECIKPLKVMGRTDLVFAIRIKLLQCFLTQLLDWKSFIKSTDKYLLNGKIKRMITAARSASGTTQA